MKFNLSDKAFWIDGGGQHNHARFYAKDVKKFIELILKDCCALCEEDIKKLAGEKLI